MKRTLGLGLLLSGVLLATESTTTYGIGLGQLYNGVGVNIASHDTSSMKSIALGCMEIAYGSYSGLDASCGLSVAYVSTSILSDQNNHHGLGIHLGIINDSDVDVLSGTIGLGYTYFLNEVSNSGWNFGFTPTFIFQKNTDKKDNELALLLNLGYQF